MLVVDDHHLYRRGLCEVLAQSGFEVVGEAGTVRSAVRAAAQLAPDVVVMDLALPDGSGIEATRAIVSRDPQARVLVLTVSDSGDALVDAVLAGASSYLLKEASAATITAAIRAAAAGEATVSPQIATSLLTRLRKAESPRTRTPKRVKLSPRELEVLRLVAEGRDNAEIGELLGLSAGTVKNHVSNILVKLKLDNRIQAAVYAVRSEIV